MFAIHCRINLKVHISLKRILNITFITEFTQEQRENVLYQDVRQLNLNIVITVIWLPSRPYAQRKHQLLCVMRLLTYFRKGSIFKYILLLTALCALTAWKMVGNYLVLQKKYKLNQLPKCSCQTVSTVRQFSVVITDSEVETRIQPTNQKNISSKNVNRLTEHMLRSVAQPPKTNKLLPAKESLVTYLMNTEIDFEGIKTRPITTSAHEATIHTTHGLLSFKPVTKTIKTRPIMTTTHEATIHTTHGPLPFKPVSETIKTRPIPTSTYEATIHTTHGSLPFKPVIECRKKINAKIPNIIHHIWFGNRTFQFYHYISLR